MRDRVVIGITGMPGSGKSVAADVGRKLGYQVLVMGDVVREEVASRGLEPNPESVGRVMLELRVECGAAVVAKKTVERIDGVRGKRAIVEGVRSMVEVEEFKKCFQEFELLAIHSSQETRFRRMLNRGRSDDSVNRSQLIERDVRELKVGVGSAIALADKMIVNEGTLTQFKVRVSEYLEGFLFE